MSDQTKWNLVNYARDSHITVAGRRIADCFFIVRQGKVKIPRETTIEDDRDKILVPGDFFGVASAMSSFSHIENAVALTDVALVTVQPRQYVSLIQRNTQIAAKILAQLSGRLRFLNGTLAKLTHGKTPVEDSSRLFDVAEYYSRNKRPDHAFYAYTKYLLHCPDGANGEAAACHLERLAGRAGNVKTDYARGELNRSYRKGDMIFAEGEPGDEFFVVNSGSVKISKIIDNSEVLLGTLGEGDIFGEMALLEGKPRTANAIAGEDSAIMAASKSNFDFLIENQPQLIYRITTLLANRIWSTFKQLEVVSVGNPVGKIYAILLVQLEKSRVHLESTEPHTFDVQWADLVNMSGLSEKEGYLLIEKLQEDKNIQVHARDGKVHVHSIRDLVMQAGLYRKINAREKSKR